MTMPHLMNCEHSDEGWCLACVRAQWNEMTHYRELLEQISKDARKTRARRLAESGLMFWDTQMEEKRNGNFDAMNRARINQSLPPEYINALLKATAEPSNVD